MKPQAIHAAASRRPAAALAGAMALLAVSATATLAAPTTTSIPLEHYQKIITDYDAAVNGSDPISPATAQKFSGKFSRATDIRRPAYGGKQADDLIIANPADVKEMQRIAGTPDGAEAGSDARSRAGVLRQLVVPSGSGVAVPDPDSTVRSILSRKEFQYGDPTSLKKIDPSDTSFFDRLGESLNRFGEHVGAALDRFFRWISGGRGINAPNVGPMTGLAEFVRFLGFLLLIVVVGGGGAYLVIRWYQNGGRLRFNRPGAPALTGLELGPDEIADPLGSARRLAEFGDYRGAVRLVYIASLRRLAGAGLLVLEPNRTNWEYQGQLRSRSASVYAAMLPATQLFDRIWYGNGKSGPDDFDRMARMHDALPQSPNEPTGAAMSPSELATSAAETDR